MMKHSCKPDMSGTQLLDTFQGGIGKVRELPYAIFLLCPIRNISGTGIAKKAHQYLINNCFHFQLLVVSG